VDADKLGLLPNFLYCTCLNLVAGALGIAVAGWLWLKGWRAEALFLLLVSIPDFFNIYLRAFIARPRPASAPLDFFGGSLGYSFPSGTALHYILFCGFIIYLSRSLINPGFLRFALWALLGLFIPVIGIYLVYDGRHWPSDVLGAYVYGAFYLVILVWCYQKYVTWRRSYPQNHIPAEKLPALARPFAWMLRIIY